MSQETLPPPHQIIPSETVLRAFYDASIQSDPSLRHDFATFNRQFTYDTHLMLPAHLVTLFGLDSCSWVKLKATSQALPVQYIAARQEGSDTVTTQLSDTNICIMPSGNGERPDKPYLIKFTGVATTDYDNQKMIVSASYMADTGALFAVSFSANSKNLPNPLGLEKPNIYVDYTGSSYQAYNRLVRPIETYMRSPFEGGIVTPAMVEATNDHTHMINLFVPQRVMDPQRPFSLYENQYTPEIILFLNHETERGQVCVGQIQSDLEEWQFMVDDHLEIAS